MRSLKLSLYICLAFVCAFVASTALAADRASIVQGRIQSALGNVLQKNDYMIVVNKLDDLEGGTETAVAGVVRPLPGLNAGVDTNGQVVGGDSNAKDYNGAIVISVIIDPAVRKETFDLIQKTVPELAGGLRDMDEFKVTRASLRQTPQANPNAPQVTINNQQASKEDQTGWSALWRHAAVLLMLGGILVWFLSRISNKPAQAAPQREHSNGHQDRHQSDVKVGTWAEINFSDLDSKAVALYMLKELSERRTEKLATWAELTKPWEQRKVLQSYPGWVASYIEKQMSDPELKKKANKDHAPGLYREMAVLEQNLTETLDRQRAFLMWFPAPGLRLVTRHQLDALSASSKLTLLKLRQDLGSLIRVDDVDLLETVKEPTAQEIEACWVELRSWSSRDMVPDRSTSADIVVTMAGVINRLTEFGPIHQQLEAAKVKLAEPEFTRLQTLVVSSSTPYTWDIDRVKEWLRIVDPQDYQWWLSVQTSAPTWDLETSLRPLRRAMFKAAESANESRHWNETNKKEAAFRILQQLRYVHLETEKQHAESKSA